MQSESVENIFSRAWTLLVKNPVIVVPGIIVGIVAGIVVGIVAPAADPNDPTTGLGAAAAGLVRWAVPCWRF